MHLVRITTELQANNVTSTNGNEMATTVLDSVSSLYSPTMDREWPLADALHQVYPVAITIINALVNQ